MKKFMGNDFLLHTDTAKTLYTDYASKMPIYDYHCHLPVQDIAENKKFKNIVQMWLTGDHYKWRALRSNGIDEKYITGNASDWEKFYAWAKTLQNAVRNPLYHWAHLELKNYFDITDKTLNQDTAKEIYEHCNRVIQNDNFTPFSIFKKMNVKVIGTTDDPADDLQYHRKLRLENTCPAKVYPTFRPDKGMAFENPALLNSWVDKLERISRFKIRNYDSYVDVLHSRHDFFHKEGCRSSDHSFEVIPAEDFKENEICKIFKKARSGKQLNIPEINKIKTALMLKFGEWNSKRGWAMQLRLGVMRNRNSRMFKLLGPDSGFDSICDLEIAKPLARFLDTLDSIKKLPKTILYNLNSKDNDALAAMLGNFQDGSIPGKMQYGSTWWFQDNKDGIKRHIRDLSNLGLISRFIGLPTDSRSFLSYPRHEYFRRILCNVFGKDIENGELPNDIEFIGKIIKNICYHNASRYFDLP